VIPPTRGHTGGVVFRIDDNFILLNYSLIIVLNYSLIAAGAQREKEEPSLGFKIIVAAGAQQEKEEPSLEEATLNPKTLNPKP
jgi:hypothetical protein